MKGSVSMKKICVLLVSIALICCLVACGTADQPLDSSDNTASADSNAEKSEHIFVYNGVNVSVNDEMSELLSKLGEPKSYFEAASCAFDGLDKTYTYSGFVITTRPEGEKDYVNSILLTDDSVTTTKGVYIGSSREDVVAAYGESSGVVSSKLTYSDGGVSLNFIIENGKVISIEYLPA